MDEGKAQEEEEDTGLSEEEQKELKDKAHEHAYNMRKALDASNLNEALANAIDMLTTLTHTDLSVHNYYTICMSSSLPLSPGCHGRPLIPGI